MQWIYIWAALALFSALIREAQFCFLFLALLSISCIVHLIVETRKETRRRQQAILDQIEAEREELEREREAWKREKEEQLRKNKTVYEWYPVAGAFAHEDDIFHNLMRHNAEYDYSKADMIDYCQTDTPIYKWVPKDLPVSLVPEPDNKYDHNAIRIEVGGILIGYIPKRECKKIREHIDADRIVNVTYYATGGVYKTLTEDYDPLTDKSQYTVETGRSELSAEVYVKVRTN